MKHHVERTSPKGPGMPFIGTCRLCGKSGLPASAALEDCENVRGLSVEAALIETITGEPQCDAGCGAPPCPRHWPDPTPEMLEGDALFDAIWATIKTWDINVPSAYAGYCGATGNHVRAIYDAVKNAGR